MAARRVGQLSFVSARLQGGQDPLDLFRRPTVGQLAAGLTPSILPWQSSLATLPFCGRSTQLSYSLAVPWFTANRAKMADFFLKSAIRWLRHQNLVTQ